MYTHIHICCNNKLKKEYEFMNFKENMEDHM